MKSLSRVRPSATPWTAAYQAPPSMGFSRQEYWNGVPLPSPNLFLLNCKFCESNDLPFYCTLSLTLLTALSVNAEIFRVCCLLLSLTLLILCSICHQDGCSNRVFNFGTSNRCLELIRIEVATHSSVPAWRTPWREKPGRLLSMESQRVRHD